MATAGSRHRLGGLLLLVFVAVGCANGESGVVPPESTVAQGPDHPPPEGIASETPQLDSMVVIGHSGTTGFGSDPTSPDVDVPENSWATGSNPEVRSLYQRLLVSHPQLRGHSTTLGVDGSTVDDLAAQLDRMSELDPVPDLVVIQTLDNDLRCDGTDTANQGPFAQTLDEVLTGVDRLAPLAQVFVVDQWASARTYAEAVQDRPEVVADRSGTGPCDTFTASGEIRPAGVASLVGIVDGYYAQLQRVCSLHARCWTDEGAIRRMPLRPGDLTVDAHHLTVPGLAVMARFVWQALPAAIKDRE
jgi:hypothetical protein